MNCKNTMSHSFSFKVSSNRFEQTEISKHPCGTFHETLTQKRLQTKLQKPCQKEGRGNNRLIVDHFGCVSADYPLEKS